MINGIWTEIYPGVVSAVFASDCKYFPLGRQIYFYYIFFNFFISIADKKRIKLKIMEDTNSAPSYGKRPFWHLLVVYAIIGVVVYALIYYFVIAKRNTSASYSSPQNIQQAY